MNFHDLFKGYVPTKDKGSLIPYTKANTELYTLQRARVTEEFGGVLHNDYVLVDLDNLEEGKRVFQLLKALDLSFFAVKTDKGFHFYFNNVISEKEDKKKYFFNDNVTRQKCALGVTIDVKCGHKNGYAILRRNGKDRICCNETSRALDVVPSFFKVIKKGEFNCDFIEAYEKGSRNDILFRYKNTLVAEGFNKEESKDICRLINDFIFTEPLESKELETLLRDDTFFSEEENGAEKKKKLSLEEMLQIFIDNNTLKRFKGNIFIKKNNVYLSDKSDIDYFVMATFPDHYGNRNKRNDFIRYLEKSENIEEAPFIDTKVIAFKNGYLNLETMELESLEKDYFVINAINHNYHVEARSEVVESTFKKIACDNENIEKLLYEIIGYCMISANPLEKAFILLGEGANGKTTYLKVLGELIGSENATSLDLRELNKTFNTSMLFNKLVNLGDDISSKTLKDTSVFKKLASSSKMKGEAKFQNPFTFESFCKNLFSCNVVPNIGSGEDFEAIKRRLIIIPFNAKFSNKDSDYDPNITNKMTTEESIEYIICKSLVAVKEVLERKSFTNDSLIDEVFTKYELQVSSFNLFADCITREYLLNKYLEDIYRQYNIFCVNNNVEPLKSVEFGTKLKLKFNIYYRRREVQGFRVNQIVDTMELLIEK